MVQREVVVKLCCVDYMLGGICKYLRTDVLLDKAIVANGNRNARSNNTVNRYEKYRAVICIAARWLK